MTSPDVALAQKLWEDCGQILRNHPPEIQGAVLADLMATWLAGHIVHDGKWKIDRKATDRERRKQLILLISAVKNLVGPNEARVFETLKSQRNSSTEHGEGG